jgi:hypothetical protein
MFDMPRSISVRLMTLCRLMTDEEQRYLESEHANYAVQVYVNPTGEATIRKTGKRVFPEGAVIVKEKWAFESAGLTTSATAQPAGLGIMVKRAPNFNPTSGDWEYMYVDAAGTVTRDQSKLGHCIACHVANEEGDSVFFGNFVFSP